MNANQQMKMVIKDIVRFAKTLDRVKHFSRKMRQDNEHLEPFLIAGVDIEAFENLDQAIQKFECVF